jgi:hypothetical protein
MLLAKNFFHCSVHGAITIPLSFLHQFHTNIQKPGPCRDTSPHTLRRVTAVDTAVCQSALANGILLVCPI